MAGIFVFRPKKELDARAQVETFIRFCRGELTLWEEEIEWDAEVWDISKSSPRMGRKSKNQIHWTKMPETKRGRNSKPMAQPFGDFARAFIRYSCTIEATKSFGILHGALRVLEKALLDRSPDGEARVDRIDKGVLDRSKEIIENYYSLSGQYSLTNSLVRIHRFLMESSMLNNPCDWLNTVRNSNSSEIGIDDEIIANRNTKLPTENSYYALMEINAKNETNELNPRDQVTTSLCMVCCAAPERSAEVATMRHDLMADGHAIGNKTRLFLTWYPVKGGEPQSKPVPDAWEEVTRRAIARLQKLSAPARDMVIWYEKNPDKIYLPTEYEHLRNREWLRPGEIQELLGIKGSALSQRYQPRFNGGMKLVVRREIVRNWNEGPNPPYRYNFPDFEQYVLSQLPTNFPFVESDGDLKYSDLLNIYPVGFLNSQRFGASLNNCSLVMFDWYDTSAFAGSISGRDGMNIFGRHGYFQDEEKAKPLRIKTHAFRHMTVTMGQEAGMSDLEMAEFRGSKVVQQNEAYKHQTSKERMLALGMAPDKGAAGRDDSDLQIKPVTDVEIQALRKRGLQLHENEYGLCAHPIEQEPCPRFLACLGCTEQLCKVGDQEKTQNIERVVQRAKDCLVNAEEMKQEDTGDGYESSDADPWIKTQKATIEDGEALLEVLRDPNIPKGTWVKRTGPNRYDPYIGMIADRANLTGAEEDIRLRERMTPQALPEKSTAA